MARRAAGAEFVEVARTRIQQAKTIDELRIAQAVFLPLEFGLSIEQTAEALGVSRGWACQLRGRFAKIERGELTPQAPRGGRRRENLTRAEEAAFLAPYLEQARAGGVLVVAPIKQALEAQLGRAVALSSVYRLLHRHDWRKLAPDKRHPEADVAAQEEWKKNSPRASSKSSRSSKRKGRSG
jgi:transposase